MLKMYYDNKYGEPMKKILSVYLLFTACALSAQTTCEKRVDAHQRASTMQRVDYCLNTPEEADEATPAEVIYYAEITQEDKTAQEEKPTAKDGYYDESKTKVSRGYLGTRQFPAFTNDTLSESERAYQRRHLQEAQAQAAQKQAERIALAKGQNVAPQAAATQTPVVTEVAEVKKEVVTTETRKGVLRRQKKPTRKDNVVVIPEAIPVTAEHMQMVTEDAVYDIDQPSYEQPAAYPMPEQQPAAQAVAEQPVADNVSSTAPAAPEYNPYYESGVAVSAPVTYDQISQK